MNNLRTVTVERVKFVLRQYGPSNLRYIYHRFSMESWDVSVLEEVLLRIMLAGEILIDNRGIMRIEGYE